MTALEVQHPSEDALELYALGQLPSIKVEDVEEHLLICSGCQDRLTEVDTYVKAMKQVCREVAVVDAVRKVVRPSPWREFVDRIFRLPAPALVGAAAVLAIGIAIPQLRQASNTSETEVLLQTSRGVDNNVTAAAGKLRLEINTSELGSLAAYQVAIVDTAGKEIWRTAARQQSSIVSVRLPMQLSKGTYWVRVSNPAGDPLREFSLNLR